MKPWEKRLVTVVGEGGMIDEGGIEGGGQYDGEGNQDPPMDPPK